MHLPGWTRPAALVAPLLALAALAAIGVACSGGKVDAAGDGGGDAPASTANSFPFSGPTCTGPAYNVACWQCVHAACPATESCLTADCSGFFTCYCSCALGDTACQQSCEGALTTTCQACAQSVTNCQKQSCASSCESDGG